MIVNKHKRMSGVNLSACHLPAYRSRRGAIGLSTALLLIWMLPMAQAETRAPVKAPIIVALGDSLTAGYGLAPEDGFVPQLQAALAAKGKQVVLKNAGVSGDTSSGGLARLDWSLSPETSGVILALGANDMLRGIQPDVTRKNLETIITKLQARNIRVFLVGMLAAPNMGPAYEKRFNAIYPQLAAQYGLPFYPFFLDGVAAQRQLNLPDGIHPNRRGIAHIVARMTPQLAQFIDQLN